MRRGRAIHRVDTTARDLIAYAQSLGWQFSAADGTWDGALWMPATGRIELVDWKGARADLTPSQARLTAQGWPIRYLSTPEHVEALGRK